MRPGAGGLGIMRALHGAARYQAMLKPRLTALAPVA
jgi:hypothetical protein